MAETAKYYVGLDLGKRSDYSALTVLQKQMVDENGDTYTEEGLCVLPPGTPVVPAQVAARAPKAPKLVSRYDAKLVQRFELQTPYPNIVERVASLFCQPDLRGQTLVVDETGVGGAVVDMFKRAKRDPVKCPKCGGTGGLLASEQRRLPDDCWVDQSPACLTCGGSGKILLQANIRPIYITAGSKATPEGNGFRVAKKQLVSVLQVVLQWVPGRLRIDPSLRHAKLLVDELTTFSVKISQDSGNESYESWREKDHDDLVLSVALPLWVAERGSQQLWVR